MVEQLAAGCALGKRPSDWNNRNNGVYLQFVRMVLLVQRSSNEPRRPIKNVLKIETASDQKKIPWGKRKVTERIFYRSFGDPSTRGLALEIMKDRRLEN